MLDTELHVAPLTAVVAGCAPGRIAVGRVARIDPTGVVWVQRASDTEPCAARVLSHLDADGLVGNDVLLVSGVEDLHDVIVVGAIADRVRPRDVSETRPHAVPDTKSSPSHLILEASESIELRTGESSLVLRKDGKIVTKGKHLVSRAVRTVRIKGASVAIN